MKMITEKYESVSLNPETCSLDGYPEMIELARASKHILVTCTRKGLMQFRGYWRETIQTGTEYVTVRFDARGILERPSEFVQGGWKHTLEEEDVNCEWAIAESLHKFAGRYLESAWVEVNKRPPAGSTAIWLRTDQHNNTFKVFCQETAELICVGLVIELP